MERLLSITEAAEQLGIKKSTLYKYVMLHKIPYVKLGARLLFDPVRLDAWIKEHSQEPKAQGTEEGR